MKNSVFLMVLIVLVLALSFALQTCFAQSNVFIEIASDKLVYKSSESMALAITISNQTCDPVQFIMANSQIYDFYLYDHDQAKPIWKWSSDKMFTMVLANLRLEPGKPLTYVVSVKPLLSSGQSLNPGKYLLAGVLCAPEKIFSKPLEIEIRK